MSDRSGDSPATDQHYFSYLMRLLRTQNGEAHVWRVSLEEPLTEQMHRFDDLPGLFAFLLARTGQDRQVGGNRGLSSTDAQANDHPFQADRPITDPSLDYSRRKQEQK